MTTPTPEAIEAAARAICAAQFLGNDEGCCWTYTELVTPPPCPPTVLLWT